MPKISETKTKPSVKARVAASSRSSAAKSRSAVKASKSVSKPHKTKAKVTKTNVIVKNRHPIFSLHKRLYETLSLESLMVVGIVTLMAATGLYAVVAETAQRPILSIRNSLSSGTADASFNFGNPGDVFLACDWDGNGTDTVSLFRASEGRFYIRNSNTSGNADYSIQFGQNGDKPICGDWNRDGRDTPGVFRPSQARVFFTNGISGTGAVDNNFTFGDYNDTPIAGDWDGDGYDTIGLVRGNTFFLKNSHSTGNADVSFAFASNGDKPVVGDWDGNGADSIGMYEPSSGKFNLRNGLNAGGADYSFTYGSPNETPLSGDWNGDHRATVGSWKIETQTIAPTTTPKKQEISPPATNGGSTPSTSPSTGSSKGATGQTPGTTDKDKVTPATGAAGTTGAAGSTDASTAGGTTLRRVPANTGQPSVGPNASASDSYDYKGALIPVYRLSSAGADDQFLTTNAQERLLVAAGTSYCDEGVGFMAFGRQVPGSVEIYRFSGAGRHFYTVNKAEGTNAGFAYEGVAFFGFPSSTNKGAEVYRLLSSKGKHLFTASLGERQVVLGSSGWADEGVGFRVGSADGQPGQQCSKPATPPPAAPTTKPAAPPSGTTGGQRGGTAAPVAACDHTTELRTKSTNTECVKKAQKLLNSKGYDTGGVDGDFGTKTLNAVKGFQATWALPQTGVINTPTWDKLECPSCGAYNGTSPANPSGPKVQTGVLMEGPISGPNEDLKSVVGGSTVYHYGTVYRKFGTRIIDEGRTSYEDCSIYADVTDYTNGHIFSTFRKNLADSACKDGLKNYAVYPSSRLTANGFAPAK